MKLVCWVPLRIGHQGAIKKVLLPQWNWSFGWGTDLRFKLCLCSLLNPTENLGLYSNLSCIQITKAHYSFYLHRSHDEWQVCPLHSALFYSLNSCWVAAKSHVWEMLLIASEPSGATSLLKSKPSAHISFFFHCWSGKFTSHLGKGCY